MSYGLLVTTVCKLILVLALLVSPPSPRITKKRFDSLKVGMQIHKVEAILGGPPGDYRSGPTVSCLPGIVSLAVEDNTLRELIWQGDEANIGVWVNRKGIVEYSYFKLMKPIPLGNFKKCLWRFDRWRRSITTNGKEKTEKKEEEKGGRKE